MHSHKLSVADHIYGSISFVSNFVFISILLNNKLDLKQSTFLTKFSSLIQLSSTTYERQSFKDCRPSFFLVGIVRYHQVLLGIVKAQKKHLDDPVPNGDFPVLHCLGIRSSVSGIGSDRIGKYMSKF